MENHPIPQDITGFQFKLIGNMTIKQFAYLATGCVFGAFFYALPTPLIVKLPFIGTSAFVGFSFAFLPIMGRPIDTMVFNFARSLFKPTKYTYQKDGGQIVPHYTVQNPKKDHKNEKTKTSLTPNTQAMLKKAPSHFTSATTEQKTKVDAKESSFLDTLSSFFSPTASLNGSRPSSSVHIITAEEKDEVDKKTDAAEDKPADDTNLSEDLGKEEKLLKEQLVEAKKEEKESVGPEAQANHEKVLELEKLLNETLSQKSTLEEKIWELQKKLETQKKEVKVPGVAKEPPQTSASIRQVPNSMGKTVGLPIAPEDPNVVTGIVKDPRDNPLPNILVEIKDLEGNSVRAFRTNGLGQFAAATPLSNGAYSLEFEDPRGIHKFESVRINATGEIILPIEATSVDAREELRRQLFQAA